MTFDFDGQTVSSQDLMDAITAIAAAPVLAAFTYAAEQPNLREGLKQGMVLAERCQEIAARASESWQDLAAEAREELLRQGPNQGPNQRRSHQGQNGGARFQATDGSRMAAEVVAIANQLNQQTLQFTDGWLDLKTLFPIGFGLLALRQILVKGIHLDALPWYAAAWYTFDSFHKLNRENGQSQPDPGPEEQVPPPEEAQEVPVTS
jgi:hypothetical protein